jgi:phage terminase small subunit
VRVAKLTDKQQCFVDEYLIDLNATQAAIRAGYSAKTADQQGSRMLANVKVKQAVAEKQAQRSKRTGVNQDRVVLELAKVAFAKMTDIVDSNGRIKEDASPDDLACIESIKYKESDNEYGGSVEREVKIASKLKALELLGKHLGMWSDKFNVTVEKSEKLDDIISQLGGEGLEE